MRRFIIIFLTSALEVAAFSAAGTAKTYREPKAIQYDQTRLSDYSDLELIDLLSAESEDFDAANGGKYAGYIPAVEKEILRRRPVSQLLDILGRTEDMAQPYLIMEIFARMKDPQADAKLRIFLTKDADTANFVVARYFGQKCDLTALGILNTNYNKYGISSVERATVADVFGDCRYRPGIPNLISSVDAASLNLVDAAQNSLSKIFPSAHIAAADPFEMQKAWAEYVRSHPF